ncbi:hypothetical protein EDEG_04064 [Edhazardia aedis USNM 41457]|uniref:Uncharacterized protein n=1 Tax=Edhazardia aedis (strain USNM 41457) TaxID=1003232 RepID=J8ZND7_EDHAE|nr:hypothetical protein EDEG_04064 [Edhazardia aedis USNM 41457]|eukprot:EJW01193.1 hypothetical protein EDEG_04064 [Edhazardia aedis USNM 41457]
MEHKINPLEEPPVYEVASGLPSYDEIIGVKTIANVESNATVNSTAEPIICANLNTGTIGVSSNETNDFVIHANSMQNETENTSISNHGYNLNDVFCRTEFERNNEYTLYDYLEHMREERHRYMRVIRINGLLLVNFIFLSSIAFGVLFVCRWFFSNEKY